MTRKNRIHKQWKYETNFFRYWTRFRQWWSVDVVRSVQIDRPLDGADLREPFNSERTQNHRRPRNDRIRLTIHGSFILFHRDNNRHLLQILEEAGIDKRSINEVEFQSLIKKLPDFQVSFKVPLWNWKIMVFWSWESIAIF